MGHCLILVIGLEENLTASITMKKINIATLRLEKSKILVIIKELDFTIYYHMLSIYLYDMFLYFLELERLGGSIVSHTNYPGAYSHDTDKVT